MSTPALASVAVGDQLPALVAHLTRAQLVRYAGASGDFNPIHWNARVATSVGLPDVIAHGMLTMATAGRVVSDWVGDPGRIRSYEVRFTRPVVVTDGPDDTAGATLEITAKIGALDEAAGTARIDITATFNGQTVLGKARAVVALA